MQENSPFIHPSPQTGTRAAWLGRYGLIAALFLCSATALFGQTVGDSTQPLYVGKISFEQRNVFDESDSSLFRLVGSVANRVHVMTGEEVIRRELLFKEGDPYDQRLVDESGQNLRQMGIVGDVSIASDTLPDNSVNVTVRARDRWTLRPGISMRQEGDRGGFALSVRDDNFLGNAQQLKLGYIYLSGPGNPHGGEIFFAEPRLWGSRWNMNVRYAVSQDSRVAAFSTGSPFYSDRVRWAARFSADVSRSRFPEFRDGQAIDRGYLSQENEMAWVATSSRGAASVQVAGAYVRTRTRSMGWRPRPFENVDFVIGSLSLLSRRYATRTSPDFAGRTEDVPQGFQAGVAFGRNLHLTKSGEGVDYFGKIYGQKNMAFGENFLVSYRAMVTAYFDRWTPHETYVSGVGIHYLRLSQNQNIIGRVMAVIGSRLDPGSQFVLGASSGLRGYRNYEFYGQKMLLVNLEHRILSLVRVWFVRLGGALFFDSGALCSQDESLGKQRFHSSAGFGLRINTGTGMFRLDWAYNLDQRRVSLAFSANQLFGVFAPLDFLSPVPEQSLR